MNLTEPFFLSMDFHPYNVYSLYNVNHLDSICIPDDLNQTWNIIPDDSEYYYMNHLVIEKVERLHEGSLITMAHDKIVSRFEPHPNTILLGRHLTGAELYFVLESRSNLEGFHCMCDRRSILLSDIYLYVENTWQRLAFISSKPNTVFMCHLLIWFFIASIKNI